VTPDNAHICRQHFGITGLIDVELSSPDLAASIVDHLDRGRPFM